MSQSKLKAISPYAVEIVTEEPAVTQQERATGWGENAQSTLVVGKPMKLTVVRNGQAQFGLRVSEDGTLTLTDYDGMGFRLSVPQNLTLEPMRPWKDKI
jgi:hypothetical protein